MSVLSLSYKAKLILLALGIQRRNSFRSPSPCISVIMLRNMCFFLVTYKVKLLSGVRVFWFLKMYCCSVCFNILWQKANVDVAKCALTCSWLPIQEIKLLKTSLAFSYSSYSGQRQRTNLHSELALTSKKPPVRSAPNSKYNFCLFALVAAAVGWAGGENCRSISGIIAIYSAFVAITERCQRTLCFW